MQVSELIAVAKQSERAPCALTVTQPLRREHPRKPGSIGGCRSAVGDTYGAHSVVNHLS